MSSPKQQAKNAQTTSNARGITLENRMIMYCFVKGFVKQLKDFRLEYQVPEAEKFDDVVFDEGNEKFVVIQLKHKEDQNLSLSHLDLFTNKFGEPFNLLKYVLSVNDMNKKIKFKGNIKMAVVYTNIDIDVDEKDQLSLAKYPKPWFGDIKSIQLNRMFLPYDNILYNSSDNEGKFYKFSKDDKIVDLLVTQAKFLHNENLDKISKKLKKNVSEISECEVLEQIEIMKLTNFNKTREEIKEALKPIVYAVRQPNDEELMESIKKEIETYYGSSCVDEVYNNLEVTIRNWCDTKNKGFPEIIHFENANSFFQLDFKSIMFDVLPPIDSFSGREEELSSILSNLYTNHNVIISQTIAISGLGGIGKTQLTRKFIAKYGKSEFYNRVMWIAAQNESTVFDSFLRLAEKLRIPDIKIKHAKTIISDVIDYFDGLKTLFVFDNYDDIGNNGFVQYCCEYVTSKANRPYYIFTSRKKECLPDIPSINLDVFKFEEAKTFVETELAKIPKFVYSETEIELFINQLEFFPLALQQAITYIKMKNKQTLTEDYTLTKYLEEYELKKKDLLGFDFRETFGNYGKPTLTTFNMTFDAIEKDQTNGSIAIQILKMLAYLYADAIDPEMFFAYFENDKEKVNDAIFLLEEYFLITIVVENQKTIKIHRVIQTAIQHKFREEETTILENTIKLIRLISPEIYDCVKKQNSMLFNFFWDVICFDKIPTVERKYEPEDIIHISILQEFLKKHHMFHDTYFPTLQEIVKLNLENIIKNDDVDSLKKIKTVNNYLGDIKYYDFRSDSDGDETYAWNVMKYLIEIKVLDPNTIDIMKESLLHVAVKNGLFDLTEVLIKHGADVNVKDFYEMPPLHYAKDAKIIELLKKNNAELKEEYLFKKFIKNINILRKIIYLMFIRLLLGPFLSIISLVFICFFIDFRSVRRLFSGIQYKDCKFCDNDKSFDSFKFYFLKLTVILLIKVSK